MKRFKLRMTPPVAVKTVLVPEMMSGAKRWAAGAGALEGF